MLKDLPTGRNWQYDLGAQTLLRNTGSVRPELDGWWLVGSQHPSIRIAPRTALLLLRGLRAERHARWPEARP